MILRSATRQDSQAIGQLFKTVFADTYGSALDDKTLKTHLEHCFSAPAITETFQQSSYFIIQDEHMTLAVMKLRKHNAAAEIEKLYVHSDVAGKGIGSRLLKAASCWANAHILSHIWLKVWKENKVAIRMYENHGFKIVGRTNVYVGKVVFDDFIMEKEL